MSSRRNTRGEAGPGRLTARSVVASTLLGVSPPQLPTRVLVATAELLGVRAGAARVAMSRMVAAGELEATADGYRLVGHLVRRQARQDLSRSGPPKGWNGSWRVHVVAAEAGARPAAERAELRAALGALRHAELREGVWLRPDNLPGDVLPDAERVVRDQTVRLESRVEEPDRLAARLWDLDGWADRARGLDHELRALPAHLDTEAGLAEAFVVLAAVLRHLQADPLLPDDLLPDRWPGPTLRRRQAAIDGQFKVAIAAWQHARH